MDLNIRKTLIVISATLAMGTAAMAVASPASARVVCNRYGDCWQTNTRYSYPRDMGVRIYSDRYAEPSYRERQWRREARRERREWRESRPERGYYKSGVWIQF
jgi:hypothetical protein